MHDNGDDENLHRSMWNLRKTRSAVLQSIEDVRAQPPVPAADAMRARAIAITKLQEAAMWLNVAIMGEPR